jgi:hypothetical protein
MPLFEQTRVSVAPVRLEQTRIPQLDGILLFLLQP